jgi:hypothetical protein
VAHVAVTQTFPARDLLGRGSTCRLKLAKPPITAGDRTNFSMLGVSQYLTETAFDQTLRFVLSTNPTVGISLSARLFY